MAKPSGNNKYSVFGVVETEHMFDLSSVSPLAYTTSRAVVLSIQSELVSRPMFPHSLHPVL